MFDVDGLRKVKVLAICDAALAIIKDLKVGKPLTTDEKFAITDSHKEMFFFTSDLIKENERLKSELSDIKQFYKKQTLSLEELLEKHDRIILKEK